VSSSLLSFFFDTATLVLIWMVQLVVYPSFKQYNFKDLKHWHRDYTKKISKIVIPIMFGQLLVTIYSVIQNGSVIFLLKLIAIIGIWILTFAVFVPLHKAVESASEEKTQSLCLKLVKKNWSRTIVWTLVFFIGIYQIATSGLF